MAMATNLKRLTPAMARFCFETAAHGTRVLRLCGRNKQADDIESMDTRSNERVMRTCNVYGTVGESSYPQNVK